MSSGHLLLDAGNSALKLCFEEDLATTEVEVLRHGTYDIKNILQRIHGQREIGRLSLACVYQQAFSEQVEDWCKSRQVELVIAVSRHNYGKLVNGYDEVSQLGVDRWLSMIALWQKLHKAFFVVSCGTAITFDAVDSQGLHQGGIILPGLELMRQSLVHNTAAISNINGLISVEGGLAKNTADAISLGTTTAVTALIEKMMTITGLKAEQGNLTGGCAEQIANAMNLEILPQKNLVLTGLVHYVNEVLES